MKSIKFEISPEYLPGVISSIGTTFYVEVKKISDSNCIVELTPSITDDEKIFKDIMYAVLNMGSVLTPSEITFIY